MNYRDDRDALRSEVDTLQQELATAREDQARLQQIEQRLEAAKREIDALEAEVGRTRRAKENRPARLGLSMAISGAALALGVGVYLFAARQSPPPPTDTALPTALPDPPRALPPPTPAEPARPAETAPLPVAPKPEAQATWSATVTKSDDPKVRPGAACRIDAKVVPDASGMHVTGVKVTCGAQTIYDQSGRLNGMAKIDSDAKQRSGPKPGTWVYDLAFSDVGTRSPTRNQTQLDSGAKLGKVWSENLPEFRIDLAIKSGSDPVDIAVLGEPK
jgi:hypothetical protein